LLLSYHCCSIIVLQLVTFALYERLETGKLDSAIGFSCLWPSCSSAHLSLKWAQFVLFWNKLAQIKLNKIGINNSYYINCNLFFSKFKLSPIVRIIKDLAHFVYRVMLSGPHCNWVTGNRIWWLNLIYHFLSLSLLITLYLKLQQEWVTR